VPFATTGTTPNHLDLRPFSPIVYWEVLRALFLKNMNDFAVELMGIEPTASRVRFLN
jgi:hypothetical protein